MNAGRSTRRDFCFFVWIRLATWWSTAPLAIRTQQINHVK
nr:MAG TPA_asm: hypothetical protein [Caudoviricetes sp.]